MPHFRGRGKPHRPDWLSGGWTPESLRQTAHTNLRQNQGVTDDFFFILSLPARGMRRLWRRARGTHDRGEDSA